MIRSFAYLQYLAFILVFGVEVDVKCSTIIFSLQMAPGLETTFKGHN